MDRFDSRILLFAKAPVAGYVKTRLIPLLGEEPAAELYWKLLDNTLAQALSVGCPLQLWCAPDTDHPLFRRISIEPQVSLHTQSGADLGEIMGLAANQALELADAVVLIGGDCPQLDRDYLSSALCHLETGRDAVLGPAEDGGYVLLGLKRYAAELFEGIDWGSDTVLTQTRSRLQHLGWSWIELATLWDLDREQDLRRFQQLEWGGKSTPYKSGKVLPHG